MPKLDFSITELQDYFKKRRTHHYYKQCCDVAESLRIHADGKFPGKLIEERRPNESLEVFDYRKKIYVSKTKPYFSKIESILQKIRRSSDWNIRYAAGAFDRIIEEENLESYCEKHYPIFGSVTNWAFSLLLRQYLIDANSVVLVHPLELPELENQYIEPVATVFSSDEVIDYVEGDYAVLANRIGCTYRTGKQIQRGDSYYIVTTQRIQRYDQIDGRGTFQIMFDYEHGLQEVPLFKVGGIVLDVYGHHVLYESRISGIVPEFNEAAREYSDLQASKVLHMFPERWEYSQNECNKCKGTGQRNEVINNVACQVECNTCQGQGYIAAGPYSKIMVRPSKTIEGEGAIPTPPAGFVEKDVEIIKVQEQSVKDHLYYALASINFEFAAESPLAQSGVAKSMDQDGANNTVHSIAEDLVRIMDSVYYWIARYRYSAQYSPEDIMEMLPKIAVPEKYDIISGNLLGEQIKLAKDNNANAAILNAMEVEYAGKVFNNDSEIAEMVNLVLQLDPLANITEDDKMSRLSNKGITQQTYVISSNINQFVQRAIEENAGFMDFEKPRQREIIAKYAADMMAEQDSATQITTQIIPPDEEEIDPLDDVQ